MEYTLQAKENNITHSSVKPNQVVKSYPSQTIVHAKLEMTEPDDADEIEAVMASNDIMNGGIVRRQISSGYSEGGVAISSQMESSLNALAGGGRAMPEGLKDMMERGFGRDFSQVRFHTDASAAEMSNDIHAKAFTYGNDIYFNRGQFNPESHEGQKLVAHELTHIVQGNGKVGLLPQEELMNENDGSILGIFSIETDTLYIFDTKNSNSMDEIRIVEPMSLACKDYSNQIIKFTPVFSGGEYKDGKIVNRNEGVKKPIPEGKYDIFDNLGVENKNNRIWYKLDMRDDKPMNDKADVEGRNAFRLHPGTRSHGCITLPKDNMEKWNLLDKIIKDANSTVIEKDLGIIDKVKDFFNDRPLYITRYGTMIVKKNISDDDIIKEVKNYISRNAI